jgi:hypothetical protein
VDLHRVIQQHARHGALLDTNLLLVYGIGRTDRSWIARHKRTREYSIGDFELIVGILAHFQRLITTPHILAELSNLAINYKDRAPPYLNDIVATIEETHELHVPKESVVRSASFPRLGVTDSGIAHLATQENYLVVTADLPLWLYLQSYQCDALNLNHLRSAEWLRGFEGN